MHQLVRRVCVAAATTIAAAAAAFAGGAITQGAAAEGATAQISSAPHILARPRNVMVNGTAMLTGTGFPIDSLVHLQECGSAAWMVPQEPCDTTNEITLMSGPSGRFATPFKAQLCPRKPPRKPPVTGETCYIGEPHLTGEDTIGLVGAAKITVTYP
jgi:hypothetical protein